MAETPGSLVDKLITVDMKMWVNQEFLYEVRKMDFSDFVEMYCRTDEQRRLLFDRLVKCCDLNVQRNRLIFELDEKLIDFGKAIREGQDLDRFRANPHKTYSGNRSVPDEKA